MNIAFYNNLLEFLTLLRRKVYRRTYLYVIYTNLQGLRSSFFHTFLTRSKILKIKPIYSTLTDRITCSYKLVPREVPRITTLALPIKALYDVHKDPTKKKFCHSSINENINF